jgi:hypothetical protein
VGGSSYKQISTSALWRIATPIGAGAIHPISYGGGGENVQKLLGFLKGVFGGVKQDGL